MFRKISILALIMAAVISCSTPSYFAQLVAVNPAEWYAPKTIEFEVDDTINGANMNLVVRYDNTLEADSIRVLITTVAPDKVVWSEDCVIPTPRTKKSVETIECPYRVNIEWSSMGSHSIVIHPYDIYKGVTAVGINILYKEE